ncbi:glutaredoxin 2 [Zymobacter sp. IVIA_5232.4 C2]|uniref:glutaredoxin 2 n=1 Tax=Zymobacter sp. IVIA_5232.4 C2 TaxID=3394855 RepID=UPI0039C49FAD
MKLYVYDHCPFCVKARMVFGLKQVPVELETVLNDDVKTPTALVGKKMVPILQKDDGTSMGESMDIVRYIDERYPMPDGEEMSCLAGPTRPEIAEWTKSVMPIVMRLTMPRWVKVPLKEFATESARSYFRHNKEKMIGISFDEALPQTDSLLAELQPHLDALVPLIASPEAVNGALSEDDFTLFPVLRQLTVVKGLTFPPAVNAYLHHMATRTDIPLHTSVAL